MRSLRLATRSDPPSPETLSRWAEAEAWLGSFGWPTLPTTGGSDLWTDPEWWLVADPTGGTRAVDTLPELMEALVPGPRPEVRAWWSMSDNSLVLNALIDRNLCRTLHGHPLTLVGRDAMAQRERFAAWGDAVRRGNPFPSSQLPPLVPLRGNWPNQFSVVGGNLGAMERLGQTPWRPWPKGRMLLLESLSASAFHAAGRVATLVEDPWWADIGGLILGRFTAADRDDPSWVEGCLSLLAPDLPVARWPLVGHGSDGWTVPLGEELTFL